MKVKKQGWINIYKEPDDSREYFAGSVFSTKELALEHWESIRKELSMGFRLINTIQIEWEEEE